jgi:hypothetical protein
MGRSPLLPAPGAITDILRGFVSAVVLALFLVACGAKTSPQPAVTEAPSRAGQLGFQDRAVRAPIPGMGRAVARGLAHR